MPTSEQRTAGTELARQVTVASEFPELVGAFDLAKSVPALRYAEGFDLGVWGEKCERCGNRFTSRMPWARFCSERCRKLTENRRRKLRRYQALRRLRVEASAG
jgi:predicted nucleic acid-binding Zn ribbon protein